MNSSASTMRITASSSRKNETIPGKPGPAAHVNNVDLKVLTIVAELFRTRSVSQTAENLALSQSTVSMHLATLRKHFNDPLFVKTSNGMEPTPHMTELMEPIEKSKELLQAVLEHHVVFNPATSDRMFRLCSTDI